MWLWKLCWSSNSLFFNLKLSIFFDSIFEQWRISIIISFIIYSIFYFRFKRICYFSLIPFYPCFYPLDDPIVVYTIYRFNSSRKLKIAPSIQLQGCLSLWTLFQILRLLSLFKFFNFSSSTFSTWLWFISPQTTIRWYYGPNMK